MFNKMADDVPPWPRTNQTVVSLLGPVYMEWGTPV